MTSKTAVALATVVHFLMRVSIFLEQPPHDCSPAPTLASWMFLVSVILVLIDADIYPDRYTNIPETCQIFAEFIMALLLLEFSTIIVWCSLEKTIYKLMKCILMESGSNMYYDMGGDALVGFLVTALSFFILANVSLATEYYYDGKRKCLQFYKKCCEKSKKVAHRVSSACENQCGNPAAEDSDGLYCGPTIQTRRRSCQVPSRCPSFRRR